MIIIGGNSGSTTKEITIGSDGSFDPEGFVDTMVFKADSDQNINVGITPAGDELSFGLLALTAGNTYDFTLHRTFASGQLIYISGLTDKLNIKIQR